MRYALLALSAFLLSSTAHADDVRISINAPRPHFAPVDCKAVATRVLTNGEEPAAGEHRRWENFLGKSKYAVKAGYRVSGDSGGMYSVGETCYRTN